jgi:hypothetical protein
LDALPSLPLGTGPDSRPERVRAVATGTYDRSLVALPVAQTSDQPRQTGGIAGQGRVEARHTIPLSTVALSGNADKGSGEMTTSDKRRRGSGDDRDRTGNLLVANQSLCGDEKRGNLCLQFVL